MVLKVITVGIYVVMKHIMIRPCLFEVHVTSDQGEGSEWIEYWSIDDEGKIYSEDTTYDTYEEFLREWV